ncbi:MAG: GNAT family N-acetyltransferase, partial [Chloroflexota bacterium]|nr:GNAT family N-acetyltransferase [Chloroflexota bacterium]
MVNESAPGDYDGHPIVNIVGERVALGPQRRDLLPTYQRWINDFSALRTLGGVAPGPTTLEQEVRWYDVQSPTEVRFTIYERAAWRPIGTTALHGIDYRNQTAIFGIFIGEAEARGKGHGTEATRLTLDYAFTALGLHSVMLTVAEFNLAGQRAYARAGFRECGRRRQCRWLAGRLWDELSMDCLATEFESPVLAQVFVPD